jgi:predicted dehydrogenase
MMECEKKLLASERMQAVSIVTPNHMHFPAAEAALNAGFHVISDKPATHNLEDAKKLRNLVEEKQLLYFLTHNYLGYPMVKQLRAMILGGELGDIWDVRVEYPQGWLSTMLKGQKQATWRGDPAQSGEGGAIADIGTHCVNLTEYVTGMRVDELAADLSIVLWKQGRLLDDLAHMMLRFPNDARGTLDCAQVHIDHENDLAIRVYGSKGSAEWHQIEPNTLLVRMSGKPMMTYRTGHEGYLCAAATAATRMPPGHPEGYLEGFANIYKNAAAAIRGFDAGKSVSEATHDFTGIDGGVYGLAFIHAAVLSSQENSAWTKIAPLMEA